MAYNMTALSQTSQVTQKVLAFTTEPFYADIAKRIGSCFQRIQLDYHKSCSRESNKIHAVGHYFCNLSAITELFIIRFVKLLFHFFMILVLALPAILSKSMRENLLSQCNLLLFNIKELFRTPVKLVIILYELVNQLFGSNRYSLLNQRVFWVSEFSYLVDELYLDSSIDKIAFQAKLTDQFHLINEKATKLTENETSSLNQPTEMKQEDNIWIIQQGNPVFENVVNEGIQYGIGLDENDCVSLAQATEIIDETLIVQDGLPLFAEPEIVDQNKLLSSEQPLREPDIYAEVEIVENPTPVLDEMKENSPVNSANLARKTAEKHTYQENDSLAYLAT